MNLKNQNIVFRLLRNETYKLFFDGEDIRAKGPVKELKLGVHSTSYIQMPMSFLDMPTYGKGKINPCLHEVVFAYKLLKGLDKDFKDISDDEINENLLFDENSFVDHVDGNPYNNHYDNLVLSNSRDNQANLKRNAERKTTISQEQATAITELLRLFPKCDRVKLAQSLRVHHSAIPSLKAH